MKPCKRPNLHLKWRTSKWLLHTETQSLVSCINKSHWKRKAATPVMQTGRKYAISQTRKSMNILKSCQLNKVTAYTALRAPCQKTRFKRNTSTSISRITSTQIHRITCFMKKTCLETNHHSYQRVLTTMSAWWRNTTRKRRRRKRKKNKSRWKKKRKMKRSRKGNHQSQRMSRLMNNLWRWITSMQEMNWLRRDNQAGKELPPSSWVTQGQGSI